MNGKPIQPTRALPADETAAKGRHLEFLLAHIDPRFAGDTNMEVGRILIALAYPVIVVIGSKPDRQRCRVDVSQPGFHVEPDCYPIKQFLERFPHVCMRIIEAHEEMSRNYADRQVSWPIRRRDEL